MTAVILKPSKDTKWLTLEVCKDYSKGECDKNENECKFAHPPSHVEASNGKVICCFDSIKSKCQRTTPPCKYLHPPGHLRDQLLEKGRQNLIVKNLQLQNVLNSGIYQPLLANSHNYAQPPSMAYPLGSCAKTVVTPQTYQTIVLPHQPYETATSPYLIQPATPMQTYQIYNPTPGHQGVATNPRMIQIVSPPSNFIYLNGTNGSVSSANGLTSAPIANHNYPAGVQIIPYNDTLLQQQQHIQQQKLQQQYLQTQQQQNISSFWGVEEKESYIVQHNSRKRSYHTTSSTPPSSLPSSSSSSSSLFLTSNPSMAHNQFLPGYLPGAKRPALVDAKSGLPIYNTNLPTSISPQFIPIPISHQTPYLHRF